MVFCGGEGREIEWRLWAGNRVPFSMLRERDPEKENSEAERLELMHSLREEGKSYREIAEIMDISKSSVHRILSY